MKNYIDTKDTAKLIRQALKESFGKTVKFSVTIDRYAGGSSIDVKWTDGPTEKQVEAVIGVYDCHRFSFYEDYHYTVSKLLDGEPVDFGGRISTTRHYSTAFLQRFVDKMWGEEETRGLHPRLRGIPKPTVSPETKYTSASIGFMPYDAEQYFYGKMRKMTRIEYAPKYSPTAARVSDLPLPPEQAQGQYLN